MTNRLYVQSCTPQWLFHFSYKTRAENFIGCQENEKYTHGIIWHLALRVIPRIVTH